MFIDSSNNLYVTDENDNKVYKYNSSGTLLFSIFGNLQSPRCSVTDSSGNIYGNYILGTYFNASSGNGENPTIGQIWTQNTSDDYLRKSTPAHFISQLSLTRKATTTFTNVSSVSFAHGLGNDNLIVQVFDGDSELFWPSRINVTTDSVYVEFTTNRTGRLVVVG
jgi:hypothetical protein